MAVTLQEISSAAGVSTRTVSRVLRMTDGSPHRSETRDRVLAAARQLGYRPNAAARAARTGRFNAIAMLLGRRQEQTYLRTGLLDGIYDVLEEHDLHLTLARIPDEVLTDENFVPKLLREWMADGMLVNYVYGFPRRMEELVERYELPSIWLNAARAADCVYADNLEASREATRRLVQLGHQRIAYASLEFPLSQNLGVGHYAAADRWNGFRLAMRDAGLPPQRLGMEQPPDRAEWAHELAAMFRAPLRPTAVIAATENDAAIIVLAATMAGLELPRDLSVITYAGGLSSRPGIAVDSMVLDRPEIGRRATQMLIEKIEAPKRSLPPCALRFKYCQGATLAPPAPTP